VGVWVGEARVGVMVLNEAWAQTVCGGVKLLQKPVELLV
jgi:hypothetical protein